MWVVKLGGSLAHDARLPAWLDMLAGHGAGRVMVVPGGGAFADVVRAAQARWRFDDLAAHNMAVLAMAQTAHLLHALEPRLVLADEESGIRAALHSGHAALWLPFTVLRDAPDLLTSWDVTSDSLALWLARRLNAERLVVVKAGPVPSDLTIAALSATGTVDVRFDEWSREAPFPIDVVEADAIDRVRDALLGGPGFAGPALSASLPATLAEAPSRGGRRAGAGPRVRRKPGP
jgi:hypothetical protein